jgi:hypothetical protein
LFGGKKLKTDDVLEDVGVEDGSVINVVPSKKTDPKKSSSTKGTVSTSGAAAAGAGAGGGDMDSMMKDMMEKAGVDPAQLDEMMQQMGGGGMPSMEESMEAMQEMMNSPIFQEYMEDPEKLEQSRQMILTNPMMKGMMASMPGFDEILNDPVKWRETMTAAASMYKNMGSDLSKLMEGGMGGMGGMGGGFGGMPDMNMGGFGGLPGMDTAGLDDLSEGE